MKTNHRRKNPPNGRHDPWNCPWVASYTRGHKGAAMRRKGRKKAASTAQRRLWKIELYAERFERLVRVSSTVKAFVHPVKRWIDHMR